MEKIKIDRINELTAIARERDLSPEEFEERQLLRGEYLQAVRLNVRSQLDTAEITNEDGTISPLRRN